MAIADQSILHDAVQRMKQLLASGISDPLSRGGGGSEFILSAWPERKTVYPVISVLTNFGVGNKMGMYTEMHHVPVNYVLEVWTTKTKQRDELSGSIFNLLRKNQYGVDATTGSGTVNLKLYDFNFGPSIDIDEPGKGGLHRKRIPVFYKYYTSG